MKLIKRKKKKALSPAAYKCLPVSSRPKRGPSLRESCQGSAALTQRSPEVMESSSGGGCSPSPVLGATANAPPPPPHCFSPSGRVPARALGLFCLQPRIVNSLIPLPPAFPRERCCRRGSRAPLAVPGGAFCPDKGAGEFL